MQNNHSWEKIIIIDDDDIYNLMNISFFEWLGYTNKIVKFKNGFQALTYLTKNFSSDNSVEGKPILLLLDLKMPVMDGWIFLEKFQAFEDSFKEQFRIVVLTSVQNKEDLDKLKIFPEVEYYEQKPLNPETAAKLIYRKKPNILQFS